MAIETAERIGLEMGATNHPTLPLMGSEGCIAPPHVRPLCTLHVCCINGAGFDPTDPEWTEKYYELRQKIEIAEHERTHT